jgi:hypothetical protein
MGGGAGSPVEATRIPTGGTVVVGDVEQAPNHN